MSVSSGCQEARNMVSIKEVECPKCREIIEVFERDGKTDGESVCEKCGYVIPEGVYTEEYQS